MSHVARIRVPTTVAGGRITLSCLYRDGSGLPVLVLPGLGMPAAESVGVAPDRVLPGRPLLVPDIPGTGDTPALPGLTVEDVAALARTLLDRLGDGPSVVVGHSMGGLAALLLCRAAPHRVAGFVNVEGNLGPGDCFVSERLVAEPLDEVATSLARSRAAGMARYGTTLATVPDPDTLVSLSRSLVAHCAASPLLDWFKALSLPRLFVTGASGPRLPYLADLTAAGIPVVSLTRCDHFPMYSRPAAYYRALDAFVDDASRGLS